VPFTILQQNGKLKNLGSVSPGKSFSEKNRQNSMIPVSCKDSLLLYATLYLKQDCQRPAGRPESATMPFCQSFMTKQFRHIDSQAFIPSGYIAIVNRMIGYLFGMYKK
jgi:hypothetical protein